MSGSLKLSKFELKSRPLEKNFLVSQTNRLVALAGLPLDPLAIDDVDAAPSIFDQTRRLKRSGDRRHARPLHAQHFGKKFLGQRNGVAFAPVTGLQQPSAKSLFDLMKRIASRRLLHQRQLDIVIANDKLADRLAAFDRCAKTDRGNLASNRPRSASPRGLRS